MYQFFLIGVGARKRYPAVFTPSPILKSFGSGYAAFMYCSTVGSGPCGPILPPSIFVIWGGKRVISRWRGIRCSTQSLDGVARTICARAAEILHHAIPQRGSWNGTHCTHRFSVPIALIIQKKIQTILQHRAAHRSSEDIAVEL